MCVRGYIEIFLLQDNADAQAKTPQQVALTPNTGADMCTHADRPVFLRIYVHADRHAHRGAYEHAYTRAAMCIAACRHT